MMKNRMISFPSYKGGLRGILAGILLCLVSVSFTYADDKLNSPWEAVKKDSFVTPPKKSLATAQPETNPAKIPFLWMLNFYQQFISPIDGEKCGMYPTCSAYSVQAIRKHGAAIGLMMTADRFLHEGTEAQTAPLIEKHGVLRYYDPVENNDFWFAKNK